MHFRVLFGLGTKSFRVSLCSILNSFFSIHVYFNTRTANYSIILNILVLYYTDSIFCRLLDLGLLFYNGSTAVKLAKDFTIRT